MDPVAQPDESSQPVDAPSSEPSEVDGSMAPVEPRKKRVSFAAGTAEPNAVGVAIGITKHESIQQGFTEYTIQVK